MPPIYDFRCETCGEEKHEYYPLSKSPSEIICERLLVLDSGHDHRCGGTMKKVFNWRGTYSIKGDNSASTSPKGKNGAS